MLFSFLVEFKKAYENIKYLNFESNTFIILSTIAQIYLNKIEHDTNNKDQEKLEVVKHLLENAISIGENSEFISNTIKQSVLGAISKVYYLQENFEQYIFYTETQLELAKESGLFCFKLILKRLNVYMCYLFLL